MNVAFPLFLFVVSPLALDHDVLVTRVGAFHMPLSRPEDRTADFVSFRNWVSTDCGRTWNLHCTISHPSKGFDFKASKDGSYWFVLQVISKDGKINPPKVESSTHSHLKVYVNVANRIVLREIVDLPTLADQLQKRISAIRRFPSGD